MCVSVCPGFLFQVIFLLLLFLCYYAVELQKFYSLHKRTFLLACCYLLNIVCKWRGSNDCITLSIRAYVQYSLILHNIHKNVLVASIFFLFLTVTVVNREQTEANSIHVYSEFVGGSTIWLINSTHFIVCQGFNLILWKRRHLLNKRLLTLLTKLNEKTSKNTRKNKSSTIYLFFMRILLLISRRVFALPFTLPNKVLCF